MTVDSDTPLTSNSSTKTFENNSKILKQDMDLDLARNWTDILIGGIDFDLPGNGGDECWNFMTLKRRLFETIFGLVVLSSALILGKMSRKDEFKQSNRYSQWSLSTSRLVLIVSLSMCYGMELTYKLATKQLIFIINPCHVTCLLQLTILCMNPFSSTAQHLFRIMINGMYFPLCACIFPVTNTLFLPGEVFTFWLEHILLLVIPLFLLYENQLKTEPLSDFSYAFSQYGYYYIYNLLICQPITLLTRANINNLLCPAITDPFAGPNYRLHTLWHQLICAFVAGKLFSCIGKAINSLTMFNQGIKAD